MTSAIERLQSALSDRYRIDRALGSGGMGTVYLAVDLKHDRPVAVKVLHPELGSAIGAASFLREIRITARLRHPHILSLFDSGEVDGTLYYVMPYVDGESLADRIGREGMLPIDEALAIAREIADALDHAHAQGVIHRDIKPENVLLDGEHAYISDFGVARALSDAGGEKVSRTGHSVGTPAYMSPEQGSGDARIDGRSDIYALACVVYEMITGEPPFTGRTARAVIVRHMTEAPTPLEHLRPTVSSVLSSAVAQGLAKSPADRPASASEFVDACAAPVPAGGWKDRPRQLLAGVGAVALLAAAAWGLVRFLDPPPALDANKVVVFPLVQTAAIEDPSGGWDVALAIGAALEHTEPLKWIDAWTWLDANAREDASAVTADQANALARQRGARYFIAGGIRGDADSTTVILRLHDVVGDSTVGQESATDGRDVPLAKIALDAVIPVLAKLIDPDRAVDLTPLTDRAPAAIALSIQGDREYRRSSFGPAQDFYERAVTADSSLVFAAVKGAQAASWNSDFERARTLIDVARREGNRLPAKYEAFASGLEAYLRGAADSAVVAFGQALSTDPEWEEAAAALGEVYLHLVPTQGPADSLAESAFRSALAFDSAFAPPMVHLVERHLARDEVEEATALLDRLRVMESDTTLVRQLDLMVACSRHAPRSFPWTEWASATPQAVLMAGINLEAGDPRECPHGALRSVVEAELPIAFRWTAMRGLQGLLLAEGRHDEAAALVESFLDEGVEAAHSVFLIDALAGAPFQAQARRAVARAREGSGAQGFRDLPPENRWLLAAWLARQGADDEVAAIARTLAARADSTGQTRARQMADAAEAHAALARGDTADAVARLRSLTPASPRNFLLWGDFDPLPIERMLLAELLLARGRHDEAHRVAAMLDHPTPIMYRPFLPRSLAVRVAAADSLGDQDLRARAHARLVSLGWEDAPALGR